MKKYAVLSLALLCTILFSFSGRKGGDIVEIYVNGKQVVQQFVHIDKSVKTLNLPLLGNNDKIEVFYSHCGHSGTNREITVRNEKNEIIRKLSFADSKDNRSFMRFQAKDLPGGKNAKLGLYYAAKELPEGRLLATIIWNDNKAVAKR